MPKVSFIIPVHNNEQVLLNCMNSLASQNEPDWEALLIDAASTDQSFTYCQQLADQDSRIKTFRVESSNIAVVKNLGLSVANGDWIIFAHPYETYAPSFVQTSLVTGNDKQCDVVVNSAIKNNNGNLSLIINPEQRIYNGIYTAKQWVQVSSKYLNSNYEWDSGKLIRKELFENLRFNEEYPGLENQSTMWKIYLRAHLVAFINNGLYTQYLNDVSNTKTNTEPLIKIQEEKITLFGIAGFNQEVLQDEYRKILTHELGKAVQSQNNKSVNDIRIKLSLFDV